MDSGKMKACITIKVTHALHALSGGCPQLNYKYHATLYCMV